MSPVEREKRSAWNWAQRSARCLAWHWSEVARVLSRAATAVTARSYRLVPLEHGRAFVARCAHAPTDEEIREAVSESLRFWSLKPELVDGHRFYFLAEPRQVDVGVGIRRIELGQYAHARKIVRVALTCGWRRTLVHEIAHLYCYVVLKLDGDPEHAFEPVWARAETDYLSWDS